ncbi:MAG: hypothetical protein KGJ27_10300, partial [candidate division NC10 bacterium]|nr:hypothetical protein [candidate division NC10 bacterium]
SNSLAAIPMMLSLPILTLECSTTRGLSPFHLVSLPPLLTILTIAFVWREVKAKAGMGRAGEACRMGCFAVDSVWGLYYSLVSEKRVVSVRCERKNLLVRASEEGGEKDVG